MEKIFNTRIEKLIGQFNFDELSKIDQAFVLESITEEEYRAFQSIVSGAAGMEAPMVPIGVQASLQKELQNLNNSKGTLLSRVINFKVPFWLVGTLGVLIFFASKFVSATEHEAQEVNIVQKAVDSQIIYKTDTIYKEIKTEPIIITKEIEKIVYFEKEVKRPAKAIFADNQQDEFSSQEFSNSDSFFSNVDISEITISKPKGRSVSQDEALMEILDDLEPSVSMK